MTDTSDPGAGLSPITTTQPGQAEALFNKTVDATKMLDKVRIGLDELSKMGDMVTPEDVIKVAGRLVAAGLTSTAMASLLADMPEGGQALAAWVQGHDQQVTQREQQLRPVHAIARHNMVNSGLKVLMNAPKAALNPLGGTGNG